MNYNEISQAVDAGVAAFATLEARANDSMTEVTTLRGVLDYIHQQGKIGQLETLKYKQGIDVAVRDFRAALYRLHSEMTLRCRELGIDVPETEDGGGGR